MAAGPRYMDQARTAQETFLLLLRVLSLPGKHRVHRAASKQRLLYCRVFTQLLLGNINSMDALQGAVARENASWAYRLQDKGSAIFRLSEVPS
jgi:hypothetical protein